MCHDALWEEVNIIFDGLQSNYTYIYGKRSDI